MKNNTDTTRTSTDLVTELKTLVSEAETMMGGALTEHSSDALESLRERFSAVQERLASTCESAKKKVVAVRTAMRARPPFAITVSRLGQPGRASRSVPLASTSPKAKRRNTTSKTGYRAAMALITASITESTAIAAAARGKAPILKRGFLAMSGRLRSCGGGIRTVRHSYRDAS